MKTNMKFKLLILFCFSVFSVQADPGDTTIVQTFTFEAQNNPNTAYDSPGRRWFEFPASDNGTEYQKILMYHKLKCFEDGTAGNLGFPCGEWDYLAYNFLFEHTGLLDSNAATHPHYLIENLDFDSFELTGDPVYNTYQYNQIVTSAVSLNESSFIPGSNEFSLDGPFSDLYAQRLQYIYRADELQAAGLSAGSIQKIAMNFEATNAHASQFLIRLKSTSSSELSGFEKC
jgi:hypothetical protein